MWFSQKKHVYTNDIDPDLLYEPVSISWADTDNEDWHCPFKKQQQKTNTSRRCLNAAAGFWNTQQDDWEHGSHAIPLEIQLEGIYLALESSGISDSNPFKNRLL